MRNAVYVFFYAVPSLGVLEAVGQFLQELNTKGLIIGGWWEGQGFCYVVVLGVDFGMGWGSGRRGWVYIFVLVNDVDGGIGGCHFLEDKVSLFFVLGFGCGLDRFAVGRIVGVGVVGLVIVAVVGFGSFL